MIITDQAKSYIEKMMKENGETNLRFTFEGVGCCGPNFGVTLAEQQDDDKVEVINGINVSVDKKVVDATENITLDFEGTEEDGGLVIKENNNCC